MKFIEAAPQWLTSRKRILEPDTYYGYENQIKHLSKFFENTPLNQLHVGHLITYQNLRSVNGCIHGLPNGKGCEGDSANAPCTKGLWTRKAGPSIINHELSIVQQLLKWVGLWGPIGEHYEPLPKPRWQPPKVMTDKEEDRVFIIASEDPGCELAYLVASITNNTTISGKELRFMRLKHLMLNADPESVFVPEAKNSYRLRRVALNSTAAKQFRRVLARAESLGCNDPEHYLFPKRMKRNQWDPEQPASESWIKKQFKRMREKAGLPWLKPHHLRHQAITRMAEAGIAPEIIRGVAGHVSDQMMRHYIHTRIDPQAEALALIDPAKRKRVERDRLGADNYRRHYA